MIVSVSLWLSLREAVFYYLKKIPKREASGCCIILEQQSPVEKRDQFA
jgi:hypothetical protein